MQLCQWDWNRFGSLETLPAVPLSHSVFPVISGADAPGAMYSWVRMGAGSREALPRPGRHSGAGVICVGFILAADEVNGVQLIARA